MLSRPMALEGLWWPASGATRPAPQPDATSPTAPLPLLDITGLSRLVQARGLDELHLALDAIALHLGLPCWIVQTEDHRTLSRPQHLTLSNHPAAYPGGRIVPGLPAHATFSARTWALRRGLVGQPQGPLAAIDWAGSPAQQLGRGITLHSREAMVAVSLTFYRPGQDGGRPLQADDAGPDHLLLVQTLHHCLLRLLAQARAARHGEWLSARERQCMSWAARGKTAAEIGQLLHLSEHTATFHIQRATSKLGASNRSHAVAIAMALGLLREPHDPR